MKSFIRKMPLIFVALIVMMLAFSMSALASEVSDTESSVETIEEDSTGDKPIGAGIAIGIAAGGGAVGMGLAVAKALEGIARQPEAEGKIRTMLMLGLVFIETAIIYALIVAILVIFVL